MKTLFVPILGLNTPADSDCYGLRQFVQSLAHPEDALLFLTFDDPQLESKIQAESKTCDQIILFGHSFGGAAVKFLLDRWNVLGSLTVALAVFFDPAPNVDRFNQWFSWQMADASLNDRWHIPSSCQRALCFYQRNEQIIPGLIAVCGVPFVPQPDATQVDQIPSGGAIVDLMLPTRVGEVININVTQWGLLHCGMLADNRVQTLVRSLVEDILIGAS
jgi:hypothetical protein